MLVNEGVVINYAAGIELPFYDNKDRELHEAIQTLGAKLDLKIEFTQNDVLMPDKAGRTIAATNCGDGHVPPIGNEGSSKPEHVNYTSIDATMVSNLGEGGGNQYNPSLNPEVQSLYVELPVKDLGYGIELGY